MNSKQVEVGSAKGCTNPGNPRLRFAQREIAKALKALEEVDAADFDAVMRLLETEDRLKDAQELAARWRRSYETAHQLLLASGDERVTQLDAALREWVGKV